MSDENYDDIEVEVKRSHCLKCLYVSFIILGVLLGLTLIISIDVQHHMNQYEKAKESLVSSMSSDSTITSHITVTVHDTTVTAPPLG